MRSIHLRQLGALSLLLCAASPIVVLARFRIRHLVTEVEVEGTAEEGRGRHAQHRGLQQQHEQWADDGHHGDGPQFQYEAGSLEGGQIVYDEDGNAYRAVHSGAPEVQAAQGPIFQAIASKKKGGGSGGGGGGGPTVLLVPTAAPQQQQIAAPAAPAPPQAIATTRAAPTTPTVVGSGGISIVTSTPVSVSNPISIVSPSKSVAGGLGLGSLFG